MVLKKNKIIKRNIFSFKIKNCDFCGLNTGPSDLQSDALPTELKSLLKTFGLVKYMKSNYYHWLIFTFLNDPGRKLSTCHLNGSN